MASSGSLLPTLLVLLAVATTASAAMTTAFVGAADLSERLEGAGSQQCWETLLDIKSCTGEIILFFLNGEAYLGPGCCRAIRVVEQRCWAADLMLSVIGFTPEEGDMLKGYCDAGDDGDNNGSEGHHRSVGGSSPAPPPHRALDGVAGGGTAVPVAGRKGLGAPPR
ncbi:egg cell-secreted protein 1.1-like [Hordeum vulgare]|nr:egg cell-secreted protein 1.1-like [Hordeum vulgare]